MLPKFKIPEFQNRSRQLRQEHTQAERAAWKLLKNRQCLWLKFRRQVPIDRYIVDFYCPEFRVIVEIDGGVHAEPEQVKSDAERDERLSELGYRVLRIPNEIALKYPEEFKSMIGEITGRLPRPKGEVGAHQQMAPGEG